MRGFAAIVTALVLMLAGSAQAATLQTVTQSIEIRADVDAVWAVVSEFESLAVWHPLVASSPVTHGNDIGSQRTITLKGPSNPKIVEELTFYNPRMQAYQYKIVSADAAAAPVTDCTAKFHVGPAKGNMTKIVWTMHFQAVDGTTPGHASDLMNQYVRVGLEHIKQLAEQP